MALRRLALALMVALAHVGPSAPVGLPLPLKPLELLASRLLAPPSAFSTGDGGGWRYLALEGGGVKGVAFAGAARALEEAGLLQRFEGFAGTSAGSQAAALLAAGFTASELEEALLRVRGRVSPNITASRTTALHASSGIAARLMVHLQGEVASPRSVTD